MTTSALPKSKAKTAYGLLSVIRALILKEPKRYDQGDWLALATSHDDDYVPKEGFPECGTVGCVAGWVKTLVAPRSSAMVSSAARRVLGLSWDQADRLFYRSAPSRLKPQTLGHAKWGAAHIAKFQQKYAKQLKAKRLS